MAVTIADIAREAGVSIATVSRVMNKTKPVSEELRQRVFDIVEKNNYKPNSLAQGLVTKQTHMIGVIIPDISNTVFGELTKGINSVCEKNGYTIMVCESGGKQKKELNLLEIMADKKMDGVLFAGVDVNDKLVASMKEKEYPVLLVTQEASGGEGLIHTVAHDNIQAVYDAVDFLIQNGHKRIAFIGGPENDYSSGQKRLIGFQQVLKDRGITIPEAYIEHGDFSFESGQSCMKKIYEENSVLPTAVMACSDLMAMGAIQFLKHSKLKIPDDISVMGFDDMKLSTYFRPELTTVRISYFDEGAQAAERLIKLIQGEEQETPYTSYTPYKIIRRSSTKALL